MITFTRLGNHGQIGNQAFQYAMLRAVAMKNGYEVAIPMKFDGIKKKDLVELEPFCLRDVRPLTADDVIVKKYKEVSHAYDKAVFDQPDGTDFHGYYQSEKYFKPIEKRIRDEFTFKPAIFDYAAEYVEGLRKDADRVVSVHVRRGDCLDNPHLFHVHTVDYFRRAMANFYHEGTLFLMISDDMPWCEKELRGPNIRYCGTPSHWHDLAVMSNCDHHIISGSTFGWWGAWLAPKMRRKRVVICPDPWFPPAMNRDTSDMVPAGWKKIPAVLQ